MKKNGALKLLLILKVFIFINNIVAATDSSQLISSLDVAANANINKNNAVSGAPANLASVIPPQDVQVQEKVTLSSDKNLSTIVQTIAPLFFDLIKKAGIAYLLEGDQFLTVFAPNDEAIKKLRDTIGNETYNSIIQDPDKLKKIVMLHLSANKNLASDLAGMGSISPLLGAPLTIKRDANNNLTLNGSSIIHTDIIGTNGVAHLINAIMMP